MKKFVAISIAIGLLWGGAVPSVANAASPKVGKSCTKVGAKAVSSGATLVCKKNGSKKVWARVAPVLGTVQNPAPLGVNVNTGKFNVSVLGYTDNVQAFICSQNMFNKGCTIDDNFNGVPDPSDTNRWVEIRLTVTNLTADPTEFYQLDSGVVGNGVVNWNGLFQPVSETRVDNNAVLPGQSTTGSLFVYLPKNLPMGIFVLKTDFTGTMYFFKTY